MPVTKGKWESHSDARIKTYIKNRKTFTAVMQYNDCSETIEVTTQQLCNIITHINAGNIKIVSMTIKKTPALPSALIE